MKSKRIFINTWLNLKPYERQQPTDSYYLKLANEVKSLLQEIIIPGVLSKNSDRLMDILACFLVSYLEDVVSGSNIWFTFTKCHHKAYGKYLPFYDTSEDYIPDEINLQDVKFLLWYFINAQQDYEYNSPFHEHYDELAESVMQIFDREYEYAPENNELRRCYQIPDNEDDFYLVREVIQNMIFNNYLLYPDTGMNLKEREEEIIHSNLNNPQANYMMLIESKDSLMNFSCSRLLAMNGREWLQEKLGPEHHLYEPISSMSDKAFGYFLYKNQDQYILLEHIASGKRFKLLKSSFNSAETLKTKNEIIYTGMVRWKNEWWFSGLSYNVGFNNELLEEEKSSDRSRRVMDFLDQENNDVFEIMAEWAEVFKKFNHGYQIAFMPLKKVDEFVHEFYVFHNKLKSGERVEVPEFSGIMSNKQLISNAAQEDDLALVYFNPLSGIEIVYNCNSAFPMPNNPYFELKNSSQDVFYILSSPEVSKELACLCFDNFRNDLPFFTEAHGREMINDFDFLLRFWKKENYHSKPMVSLV